MTRAAINSEDAPAALGAYSQAIAAGGFVFCWGTTGIDPASGGIPEGIEAQTEQALLRFQRDYGMTPDGVCGPETLRAFRRLGRKVTGGRPGLLRPPGGRAARGRGRGPLRPHP